MKKKELIQLIKEEIKLTLQESESDLGQFDNDPIRYRPKDDNPVVQSYLKKLMDEFVNPPQYDDFWDMKNLIHANKLFINFMQDELDKFTSDVYNK